MTKFSGKDMTLTVGGNSITCLQSIETDERLDIYEVECAGATDKEKVAGLKSSRMTLVLAVNQDDVTVLGYLDPGDGGAIVLRPAGASTGFLNYASTGCIVGARRSSFPVNGISIVTIDIELQDLTISAQA